MQIEDITRDNFVLPTLGPKLVIIHKDLIYGAAQLPTGKHAARFTAIILLQC